MYGANEELHSKAVQILSVLLQLAINSSEGSCDSDQRLNRTIRLLFIKLYNSIDTSKQEPIIESVHKDLVLGGDSSNFQFRINLALSIYSDCLKLKLGRRVSHISVIQMFDSLNHVMTKKNGELLREKSNQQT
jgi:hypothetical protein